MYRARKDSGTVVFPCLKMESFNIKVYSDASFNNLPNGASQEGHIVFLCDENNSAPLSWTSNKIRRVVRSTLAAEAIALNDACGNALYLKRMVSEVFIEAPRKDIPLFALTDNKSTFDAIHSSTAVSDKNLRLEIALLQQYVERKEVDISFVKGKENLSDVLTKRGASARNLMSSISNGSLVSG